MWDYMNLSQERVNDLKREAENHRLVQEAAQQGRIEHSGVYHSIRVNTGKLLIAAGEFMVERSGASADMKAEAY